MKILRDEHGVTLMELLAAIIIFTIFASIIWGFFFQSLKFNDAEVTKQQLQQEANLIIASIQEAHIKGQSYIIQTNDSNTVLTVKDLVFEHPQIKYEILNSIQTPVISKTLEIKLKLSSADNPAITYEIQTTFSRIK
ncbi:type II secretion system protein J [Chungangia koreensis]|uniref:Type II secretion system protein J n=1 Tax=Chungangia koreensis TaxID=752657 RepID=A0ABV8X714_9LACT